jgi:hypothetical protein
MEYEYAEAVTHVLTNTPTEEQRDELVRERREEIAQSEYWEGHVFILTIPQL